MPIQPKQQPPYYEPISQTKIYIATITQTSTNNPILNIIKNSIGEILWTREGVGIYVGTLTDAFPAGRTTIILQNSGGAAFYAASITGTEPDQITLSTRNQAGALADANLEDTTLIITTY